jgi:hypothetical protein
MAVDFPSSPTNGQTFAASNGISYVFSNSAWRSQAGVGGIWVLKAGDTMTGVLSLPAGSASSPALQMADINSGLYGGADTVSVATNGITRLTITTAITSSAVFAGPVGTAAAPAYSFSGDADNGMFRPATNVLGFSAAGVERLRMDATYITAAVPVLLPADPANLLEAATKQYVDARAFADPGSDGYMYGRRNNAWQRAVNQGGDVMVGTLYQTYTNPVFGLNKTVATSYNILAGLSNSVKRWDVILGNNSAESGGNAGSDFVIARYSDTGVWLSDAIGIARATGVVQIAGSLSVANRIVGTTNGAANITMHTSGNGCNFTWDGSFAYIRIDEITQQQISNAPSDARLKENIVPTLVDALAVVCATEVSQYDWIAHDDTTFKVAPTHVPIGLVAQTLGVLAPDAVRVTPQPEGRPAWMPEDLQFPDDRTTVAYVWRAIQQLNDQITTLHGRIKALEEA